MVPVYPDHDAAARRLLLDALARCDPRQATRGAGTFESPGSIRVLAIGKAARSMTVGAFDASGSRIDASLMVFPAGAPDAGVPDRARGIEADHPIPTARNIDAANAVASFVQETGEHERLVVLLSGGGSAMLTSPRDGLGLKDLRLLTGALLRSGATINELNCVRKHCEVYKGGGLGQLVRGACEVAVLSDVLGDPLDVISSGPFVPDPTTFADAIAVLNRLGQREAVPAVSRLLERGVRGEIPETADASVCPSIPHDVIGSNRLALQQATEQAASHGFRVAETRADVIGEAREVAPTLIDAALAHRVDQPTCLVFAGETHVTVRGDGIGGRNSELALAGAIHLERVGIERVAFATLGTDGVDGISPGAGAVVCAETCSAARQAGLDPVAALDQNDSGRLLDRLGALIVTGPTGTNVNDVGVVLVYP